MTSSQGAVCGDDQRDSADDRGGDREAGKTAAGLPAGNDEGVCWQMIKGDTDIYMYIVQSRDQLAYICN